MKIVSYLNMHYKIFTSIGVSNKKNAVLIKYGVVNESQKLFIYWL